MGRRRTTNQDAFSLCEEEGLVVVCDGMGGHQAGDVASHMAVDLFSERVARASSRLKSPQLKLAARRTLARRLIHDCTRDANASIHRKGIRDGDESPKSRMGTTLALVLVVSDFAVIAHVGDSRVYRIREGAIERLTEDHSIMAKAKARHSADPRARRKRKYVTRSLGTRPEVEPDVQLVKVLAGDLFLLCSDGLTDVVTDEEIASILDKAGGDWRRGLRALVKLANRRGGPDNITVTLAELQAEAEDEDDTDTLPVLKGAPQS